MSRYAQLIFACCTLLLVSACNNSSNDRITLAQIQVSASLGQITDATVTMTEPDGTPIPGATGTTGADGTAMISYNAARKGPYVVRVAGNPNAKYFDEASQSMVPFPAGQSIRAIGSSQGTSVGVTILTELAAQVADSVGSGITAADIDNINESIRVAFAPDVGNILTPPVLVNANNISSQSLGTDDASRYALRLAALAGIASNTDAPALTILQQLSDDLADGALDGNGPDGVIANLAYGTAGFVNAFANAIQLAATTLANTDLSAILADINVATSNNILQSVIDRGVTLPAGVIDKINNAGGTGGAIGSGDFDLTITGNISTAGVGTPFSLQLSGVPAPSTGDTASITSAVSTTVAGLEDIADLTITVVNNTASQVTFDVSLTAVQAGTSISLDLRYDYVASSTGGGTDDGTGGGDATGGTGGTGGSGNFCFIGDPTPTTIPAKFVDTVFSLTFAAQPGAPFSTGDVRDFQISASGTLSINGTAVADNPVLCGGNEHEAVWKDNTADLTYALSDLTGNFNEINLGIASGNKTFLGQFRLPAEPEPVGPPAALTALVGTYSTQVVQSCSGSSCPNSTSVGEMISVIIGTDGTVTYADKVISTEVTDADFRDLTDRSDPGYQITNPGSVDGESFEITVYVESDSPVAFRLKKIQSCGSGCSSSKNIYSDVVPVSNEVGAFFDKVIGLVPTTMTVIKDDANFIGSLNNFTNTSNGASPLCRTFELSAAKDRAGVQSSRNRPLFAYFSGSKGGDDYLRSTSRYVKDATTSDEIMSFFNSQLVLHTNGTVSLQQGSRDGTANILTQVLDSATNDPAKITAACADFKTIAVSVSSTSSGALSLRILDTATDSPSQTASVSLQTDMSSTANFVLATGVSYKVEVTFTSPSSLSCTVTNGTGTVAATDITDVSITCQPGT